MFKFLIGVVLLAIILILALAVGFWITLFFVVVGGIVIGIVYFLLNRFFGGHNEVQQMGR